MNKNSGCMASKLATATVLEEFHVVQNPDVVNSSCRSVPKELGMDVGGDVMMQEYCPMSLHYLQNWAIFPGIKVIRRIKNCVPR